jgi:hypothetical protein
LVATCQEVIFVRFERRLDGSLDWAAQNGPFLPFVRTPLLLWSDGVHVLARLLMMTKEQRGTVHAVPRLRFADPIGEVIADAYLGRARTAAVYSATLHDGLPVAMKVYHREWLGAMQNEHDCLVRLASTPAAVPRVVAYAPLKSALLVIPVAVPLSQLSTTFQLSS